MDGIPWILVAILTLLILLGVVMIVVTRRRQQPRRVDYRSYFVMGVICIATGVFLLILPWLLHEEFFLTGSLFIVMGVGFTAVGLSNKDKWGKQFEESSTTGIRTAIVLGVMALLGLVVFALFML